ncbi:MAG: Na+/H+ antiporter subunit E [Bacteroidales bacterium]|nr:Na+/H+ antiporter subunit E [Bacteroidales bacterium]
MEATNKISKFLFTWIVVFLVWLAFTSTFNIVEVITGIIVSFIIAIFNFGYFTNMGLKSFSPMRVLYFFQYNAVFLVALVKSNLNVARIVLSPKLPINTGIVEFETKLESDFAKMVLANSITLTPGTFTIDFVDSTFYIHWLDVKVTDPEEVYREIAEPFEKILLKIFN